MPLFVSQPIESAGSRNNRRKRVRLSRYRVLIDFAGNANQELALPRSGLASPRCQGSGSEHALFPEAPANPCRVPPAIDNGVHRDDSRGVSIIDSERKSAAEKPVIIPVRDPVNSRRNSNALNIRFKRRQEVIAQAGPLHFVEALPLVQVPSGRGKDSKPHVGWPPSEFFTSSHSRISSRSSSTAFRRASSKSSCHCGTDT